MRPNLAAIVALVGLVAGCGTGPKFSAVAPDQEAQAPDSNPREQHLLAGVSEQRCQQTVRDLVALGPRMGGTSSGGQASAYLREAFEEAGLEVQVFEDSERWCHEEASWSCALEWTDAAGEARRHELTSAWPFGFSPSGSGRAPLSLEIGEGVAQLSKRNPRPKKQVAVALVDGASTADGRYTRVSHLRRGDSNSVPVFGIGRFDGERARALLAAGRAPQLAWSLEAKITESAPRTVVARLAAREGAAPGFFLFCAHGDSDAGGPGADDNASGEAVVLEIARAWAAAVGQDEAFRPAREVRFAVWGSEIHSTRDYLERTLADGSAGPLLGVLNYDQAGFGSGADQLNIEPDDLPANASLVRTALGVLSDHKGSPGFPEQWATNKSLGGTDSYVFSSSTHFREHSKPAVTLFTSAWDKPAEHPRTEGMPGESWSERDVVRVDYDAYYHSSGDTPENTTDKEPWNMGWCARVGMLSVDRWLAEKP